MATSLLIICIAAIAYAHPQAAPTSSSRPVFVQASTSYQVTGLDFVDPSTGWVAAELPSHDFAVLHTTNAGRSWTRQLTGPSGDLGEYAHFFDRLDGVVVVLGANAFMLQTLDGGKTWVRGDLREDGGDVISAAFADAWHGWLLVQVQPHQRTSPAEALYRTQDGGATWVDLGDPVTAEDWAFNVAFADAKRGWLYSRSSAAYAYATGDGGITWRRVALPAPDRGWPVAPPRATTPVQFFVAARPTVGSGVIAVIAPIPPPPPRTRSGEGGVLLGYPPLTVSTFDGGVPIINQYRTIADMGPLRLSIEYFAEPGQSSVAPGAEQVELSSPDGGATWRSMSTPSFPGAVGYAGPLDWWWVGAITWATTSNGGVTWISMGRVAIPQPVPSSLQVLDPVHAWYVAVVGGRQVLEMTADGGRSWAPLQLPPIATG